MSDIEPGKLSQFRPATRNANKHTGRGLKLLADAMNEVGYVAPITVAADGEALDGSARLETAFKKFGDEAIVIRHDGTKPIVMVREDIPSADTPAAKKIAYGANRIAQLDLEWEPLQLAADLEAGLDLGELFRPEEISAILEAAGTELLGKGKADPGPQEDKAKELQAKWQTATGQVWQLGRHRLACGDCTDRATVEAVMRGELADCAFTSAPYAVGVDYASYDDTIENLRALLPGVSRTCFEVVVPGGFAVMNFGDIASGRNVANTDEPCEYPMALEYWPVFRADGWLLWSRRIWCKPTPRVHSLWCIQSNRAATDWEHLWTFKKPGPAILKRIDGEFSSVNGWYQSSRLHGVDEGKGVHGAGMALGIAAWMITVHSRAGKIVFEPFLGTGTTLIACENLNRQARCIEIDPGYCAVAIQRWVDLTGKEPVLLEG